MSLSMGTVLHTTIFLGFTFKATLHGLDRQSHQVVEVLFARWKNGSQKALCYDSELLYVQRSLSMDKVYCSCYS